MPLKHARMLRALACALATVVLLAAKPSRAEEKEPIAVLELGGAAATNMQGEFGFGPSAAVEFEPIKNYLVIEAGLQARGDLCLDSAQRREQRPLGPGGVEPGEGACRGGVRPRRAHSVEAGGSASAGASVLRVS